MRAMKIPAKKEYELGNFDDEKYYCDVSSNFFRSKTPVIFPQRNLEPIWEKNLDDSVRGKSTNLH